MGQTQSRKTDITLDITNRGCFIERISYLGAESLKEQRGKPDTNKSSKQKTVSFGLSDLNRSDDARKQKGEVEVLWTGA